MFVVSENKIEFIGHFPSSPFEIHSGRQTNGRDGDIIILIHVCFLRIKVPLHVVNCTEVQ